MVSSRLTTGNYTFREKARRYILVSDDLLPCIDSVCTVGSRLRKVLNPCSALFIVSGILLLVAKPVTARAAFQVSDSSTLADLREGMETITRELAPCFMTIHLAVAACGIF